MTGVQTCALPIFKREYFKELLPVYRKAGAIKGEPDLNSVIETRFVEQALQELG